MSRYTIIFKIGDKEYTDDFDNIELAKDRFTRLCLDGKMVAMYNYV